MSETYMLRLKCEECGAWLRHSQMTAWNVRDVVAQFLEGICESGHLRPYADPGPDPVRVDPDLLSMLERTKVQ